MNKRVNEDGNYDAIFWRMWGIFHCDSAKFTNSFSISAEKAFNLDLEFIIGNLNELDERVMGRMHTQKHLQIERFCILIAA